MPINNKVKLCGVRTKQTNFPCRQPGMLTNFRCRMHGGKSTGPKTSKGRMRAAQANYKHGRYSQEALEERSIIRTMMNWRHETIA